MSWPVLTGVSIASGAASLSFTGAEPTSVRSGAALVIEGFSPVELLSVTTDGSKSATLVEPWPYSNASGKKALLIPLDGMLFEKVKELVTAITSVNTNFTNLLTSIQALATTDGMVDITAADGTVYQLQGWLSLPAAFDDKVSEFFNQYRVRKSHAFHENVAFYRNPVSYWVVVDPRTGQNIDINEKKSVYRVQFKKTSLGASSLPYDYELYIWKESTGWKYNLLEQYDQVSSANSPRLEFSTGQPRVYFDSHPDTGAWYSSISVTSIYSDSPNAEYMSPLNFLREKDFKRMGDDFFFDSFESDKEIRLTTDEEFSGHQHGISDVVNLQSVIDTINTALANKSASGHGHAISSITDLQDTLDAISTALSGKAASSHSHTIAISDVTDLQDSLDGKLGSTSKAADSSKLEGYALTDADTANTVVRRNASGDINARLFRSDYSEQTSAPATSADIAFRNSTTDNYIRFMTSGAFSAWLENTGILDPYKATNGYVKLNGVIIQWGHSGRSGATNGDRTVTFPTSFPSVCRAVVITRNDLNHWSDQVTARSRTKSNFKVHAYGAPRAVDWIAIGY